MKGNVPYKTLGPSTPQAPVVNDNCYGCGECVDWCPTGAITIADGRLPPVWTCAPNAVPASSSVLWADALSTPLILPCCTKTSVHVANGMFRLTKCQTNLTRIVYPPLYSGEVTKNVGISSRRFYIPQPWARFSLTKRHPLHTAVRHAPHANDIRQPFPVTKSMRIWRTEIRQINQKSPSDLPFTPFTAPFFVMQKTVSGRQADNSIFSAPKLFPLSAKRNSNLRRLKPRIQKKCVINT